MNGIMDEVGFHSTMHGTLVRLLRKAIRYAQVAWAALRRHWADASVIALLFLTGTAIWIMRIASANPAVAQALGRSARLLVPWGTQY